MKFNFLRPNLKCRSMLRMFNFQVSWDVLCFAGRVSRYKFLLKTNLTHFFMYLFIYLISLHVSSITVPIIRRSNCINTSSGMISLCDCLVCRSYDRHTKQLAECNERVLFEKPSMSYKKAIPLQTWRGREGSRRLRFPYFKTVGTWRW